MPLNEHYFLQVIYLSAIDAQPPVSQGPQQTWNQNMSNQIIVERSDVVNHMFFMANQCESILDGITEYENQGYGEEDVVVYENSLHLLKHLELQIIKTSCITMMYTSAAAEKAVLTEAVQDSQNGGNVGS